MEPGRLYARGLGMPVWDRIYDVTTLRRHPRQLVLLSDRV